MEDEISNLLVESRIRKLAALTDPNQRALAFTSEVSRLPVEDAVLLVDGLLIRGFSRRTPSDLVATEAMLLALAKGFWPVEHRQSLASAASLEHPLVALLVAEPPAPESSEPHVPRVPDYGSGRPLTLGERRALAAQPTRRQLDRLMRDPHPMVVARLLENPLVTETDVVRIAARRPGIPEVLVEIGLAPRWRVRRAVATAVTRNPRTPLLVALSLLPLLDEPTMLELATDESLAGRLRQLARLLLYLTP